MKLVIVAIAFASLCGCVYGEVHVKGKVLNHVKVANDSYILQRWEKFDEKIKELANSAVKQMMPYVMEYTSKMNISSQCMSQVMHLISGLKKVKPWAVRFVDSSAKMIDGMFMGTLSNFGVFDECISTVVYSDKARDKGKEIYRGQYCTINFKMPVPPKTGFYKLDDIIPALQNFSKGPTAINEASHLAQFMNFMSYRIAICVPSGCTKDDLSQLATLVGELTTLDTQLSRCEIEQPLNFTSFQIGVLCIYALPVLISIVATSLGLYSHYKKVTFKSYGIQILLCFNFMSNFRKFINTDNAKQNSLGCLNGIRFISMTWVVLGHTYLVVSYQMFLGLLKVKDMAKDFAFQAIVNSSVAVDTFYCLGGLLVCYLTVKVVKIGKHPFSVPLYIIHRLFRIWPIYIFAILSLMLIDQIGAGPIWYENTSRYIEACHDNWWTNILFINNFYNAESMCLPQSWYIASDFQLYVGALIVIIPLLRWPKVGISIAISIMVISMAYTGIGTVLQNYPYTMLMSHPDPGQRVEYWAHLYFKPFIHASPYCIGLLAGYILATRPKLKIPPVIQVVGWCLAFICTFSTLYGVYDWNKGRDPGMVEGLFYACSFRTVWTLGVAWTIVCCATGHGGVINWILSWKAFIPLGRLTFIVYLIHPVVQICVIANLKTLMQPEHLLGMYFFFGHLCLTYLIAFGASMVLEAPFLSLEKLVFQPAPRRDRGDGEGKRNGSLNGALKMQKNGEMVVIVPDTTEEPKGIDNEGAVVYKL